MKKLTLAALLLLSIAAPSAAPDTFLAAVGRAAAQLHGRDARAGVGMAGLRTEEALGARPWRGTFVDSRGRRTPLHDVSPAGAALAGPAIAAGDRDGDRRVERTHDLGASLRRPDVRPQPLRGRRSPRHAAHRRRSAVRDEQPRRDHRARQAERQAALVSRPGQRSRRDGRRPRLLFEPDCLRDDGDCARRRSRRVGRRTQPADRRDCVEGRKLSRRARVAGPHHR